MVLDLGGLGTVRAILHKSDAASISPPKRELGTVLDFVTLENEVKGWGVSGVRSRY